MTPIGSNPVLQLGANAVITAGASGIGRSVVRALASRGLNVVIADIDGEGAEQLSEEVQRDGGSAVAISCDVRDEQQLRAVQQLCLDRFGTIDLLMNHAGASINGPVPDITVEEWQSLFDLNVLGMVRALRVFLPDMVAAGRGHLVFTTSSLALLSGHPHAASAVPYITTKGAVIALAQSVEMYARPQGIGVTLFAPDYTATRFPQSVRHIDDDSNSQAASDRVAAAVPYPAQTPENAASVLVDALDAGVFLATATPGGHDLLMRQAKAGLEPQALTPSYFTLSSSPSLKSQ